ncbi:MAG: HD domain-containing protein [Clostridiales bacterium]|nr:HD domain-containing protein [Clostridiales bacterium]
MNLTSQKALEKLKEIEKKIEENYWIRHSICVGNSAGKIAEALNLDVDKAKCLGYIHDIGKYRGKFSMHSIEGYNYIKELGYDDEYANICLTHSYLNNDIYCTAGEVPEDIPFRTEFIKNHEYTIYEKIVNLCDLMCTDVNLTLEKRLIDIFTRRGTNENTNYHIKEAQKLKKYFDNMLGYNVYKLFPDVLDN